MSQLDPLAEMLADSLESNNPKINDGSFYAAWRAIALALWEYRQGNFATAVDWLKKCSSYPGQAQSCIATTHILMGMASLQQGQTDEADAELKAGREMVDNYFSKKLELTDNKTGQLQGWLMARIFLREAEKAAQTPTQTTR